MSAPAEPCPAPRGQRYHNIKSSPGKMPDGFALWSIITDIVGHSFNAYPYDRSQPGESCRSRAGAGSGLSVPGWPGSVLLYTRPPPLYFPDWGSSRSFGWDRLWGPAPPGNTPKTTGARSPKGLVNTLYHAITLKNLSLPPRLRCHTVTCLP